MAKAVCLNWYRSTRTFFPILAAISEKAMIRNVLHGIAATGATPILLSLLTNSAAALTELSAVLQGHPGPQHEAVTVVAGSSLADWGLNE